MPSGIAPADIAITDAASTRRADTAKAAFKLRLIACTFGGRPQGLTVAHRCHRRGRLPQLVGLPFRAPAEVGIAGGDPGTASADQPSLWQT